MGNVKLYNNIILLTVNIFQNYKRFILLNVYNFDCFTLF